MEKLRIADPTLQTDGTVILSHAPLPGKENGRKGELGGTEESGRVAGI